MDDAKKSLGDLQTTDPTIIIKDDTIELLPCYININLMFYFILLLISGLTLFNDEVLIGFIGILVSVFLIGDFLRLNNKMIIDTKNKYLIVVPNFISIRFIKEFQKIHFTTIKNVTTRTAFFGTLIFQRFSVVITLSNSDEVKIMSIGNENTAKKIVDFLKRLF